MMPGELPGLAPRDKVEAARAFLLRLASVPVGKPEDRVALQGAFPTLEAAVDAWEAAGRAEDAANAVLGPATREFDVAWGALVSIVVGSLGEEKAKAHLPVFVRHRGGGGEG